jgi:hypothetical protein
MSRNLRSLDKLEAAHAPPTGRFDYRRPRQLGRRLHPIFCNETEGSPAWTSGGAIICEANRAVPLQAGRVSRT